MEQKVLIIKKLEECLRSTKAGKDIESLEYTKDTRHEEYVHIHFVNGYTKTVCVTADSGIAMVLDVSRALE